MPTSAGLRTAKEGKKQNIANLNLKNDYYEKGRMIFRLFYIQTNNDLIIG